MQPRSTIDVTDSPGARLDVLRPLLSIEKSRLEATCVAHSQEYVDDPSNRDDRFLRVRARDLVAALGDDKPAVINLLQEVQAVRNEVDVATGALMERAVRWHAPPFCFTVDMAMLLEAPAWTQQRLLTKVTRSLQPDRYPPRTKQLNRLRATVCKWAETGAIWRGGARPQASLGNCLWAPVELQGRCQLVVSRAVTDVARESVPLEPGASIKWGNLVLTLAEGEASSWALRARKQNEWATGDSRGWIRRDLQGMPRGLQRLCCEGGVPMVVDRATEEPAPFEASVVVSGEPGRGHWWATPHVVSRLTISRVAANTERRTTVFVP